MSINLTHLVFTYDIPVSVSQYKLDDFMDDVEDPLNLIEDVSVYKNDQLRFTVKFPIQLNTEECDKYLVGIVDEFLETYYDYFNSPVIGRLEDLW